jgi:hypothetical protein
MAEKEHISKIISEGVSMENQKQQGRQKQGYRGKFSL